MGLWRTTATILNKQLLEIWLVWILVNRHLFLNMNMTFKRTHLIKLLRKITLSIKHKESMEIYCSLPLFSLRFLEADEILCTFATYSFLFCLHHLAFSAWKAKRPLGLNSKFSPCFIKHHILCFLAYTLYFLRDMVIPVSCLKMIPQNQFNMMYCCFRPSCMTRYSCWMTPSFHTKLTWEGSPNTHFNAGKIYST